MGVRGWLRGLAEAARDRDTSALLVRTHAAFGPIAFAAYARAMRADPDGRRLLDRRPEVGLHTIDPARVAALPPGTLGRAWHDHLAAHGFIREITIPDGPLPESADTRYARRRWRETHDFRHVLTGLGVSVADETVIGAFQYGMLPNGWSFVVSAVGGPIGEVPARVTYGRLREAWAAGVRARRLAFAPFEELLEEPVEAIRQRYDVADLSHLRSDRPSR